MNILIVNLTRMGDIIQSTPLLSGLKETYPVCHITYLANEPYAGVCKGIPFIDELITFNMEGMQGRMLSESMSIMEEYRFLNGFIDRVNHREYDVLINLTPSRICALLTSLIHTKEIRGLTVDGEGHRLIKDRWMRYLSTSVFNRGINPFNLVDMYIRMGTVMCKDKRLRLDIPTEIMKKGDDLLLEAGVKDEDVLIGFQPGASKEHKMWGIAQFKELAGRLNNELSVKVIVFGSKGEKRFGEEIKGDGKHDVIDMVGKTSMMELAWILKRCKLLLTNDSGTMHIAAAVGAQVVELSLGAAFFRETGPYGQGHIVIESQIPCHPCNFQVECKEMVCRDYITAESVFRVIEMVLKDGIQHSIEDIPTFSRVQIYKSSFDKDGFLEYLPLIHRPITDQDLYLNLYRIMWKEFLDGGSAFDDISSKISGNELNAKIIASDMEAIKEIERLTNECIAIIKRMMCADTRQKGYSLEMQTCNNRLSIIDAEIQKTGYMRPNLRPITNFFGYNKENIMCDDMRSIVKGLSDIYMDMKTQLSILTRLLTMIFDFDRVRA